MRFHSMRRGSAGTGPDALADEHAQDAEPGLVRAEVLRYRTDRTLVSAAMHRFEGQLTTIRPGGPCLRCIHPHPPAPGVVPDCSEAGVLGAMAGVLGAMQAVEVVKEVLESVDALEAPGDEE